MVRKAQQISSEIYLVFNLLALFIITYMLVDTFYRVIKTHLYETGTPKVVTLKDIEMHGDGAFASQEYSKIVKRNIFGATEKGEPLPLVEKMEQQVALVETLDETSLQISLLGTIAGDTQSARAIILDQRTSSQNIYRVGDSIQEASIRQILRGKIVLRHGEKDEILSMDGGEDIVNVTARAEQSGMPTKTISTSSYPLTPLFIEKANQKGRSYISSRDVSRTAPQEKKKGAIEEGAVAIKQEVLAAQKGSIERFAKPEGRISVAPLNPQNQTIPAAETQFPTIPAFKAIAKLQEPSIAAAKLPDFTAVEPFVASWAEAWKQKNIETYLSHYSTEFSTPGEMGRVAWEKQRDQRLGRPQFIKIDIRDMQKQKVSDSRAQVTFIQEYQSDIYADKVVKILELIWENGRWMIAKETSRAL